MSTNIGPSELIVILCVVLLLFGLPLMLAFVISQRFLARRRHKELDRLMDAVEDARGMKPRGCINDIGALP